MRRLYVPLLAVALAAPLGLCAADPAPDPRPARAAAKLGNPAAAQAEAEAPVLVGVKSAPWLLELKVRGVPKGTAIIWDVFPEDKATTRIVKAEQALLVAGPAGEYRVKCRLIRGEDVTELRDVVTLTGGAPAPGPEPKPPAPKPDPASPTAAKVVVVVVEETAARTPAQGKALFDRGFRDWLKAGGHELELLDRDDPAAKAAGYLPYADQAGLPAVLVFDAAATGPALPLKVFKLPDTAAALKALVEGTVKK